MSSGVYMPVQACVHERMSVCVCERERERERIKPVFEAFAKCEYCPCRNLLSVSVPAKRRLFVFFQGGKRSLQRGCCSCELNCVCNAYFLCIGAKSRSVHLHSDVLASVNHTVDQTALGKCDYRFQLPV